LILTLLFVLIMQFYKVSLIVVFNYLLFQEVLGLLLLWRMQPWQVIVVMYFKIGVPPFHYWVVSVVESLRGFVLLWFITYHKLILFPALIMLTGDSLLLLIYGLCLLYFQLFLTTSYRRLSVLVSQESLS